MIITGSTDEEHLQILESVLKRLSDYNLRAKLEKCRFFEKEIIYCGHTIDENGLHTTQDKIEAIVKAPRPQNITQLRAWLGLANYYAIFIENMATIPYPLNQLLQKNAKFKWTAETQNAFDKIIQMITSDVVLTLYDPNLPIKVACDSSAYGLGSVISHIMPNGDEKPIAFDSRTLISAEKNYAQVQKEALAVVWSVTKWHNYIIGRKFTVVTDNQAILTIFGPKKGIPATTAARLQRYAIYLQGYEYDIEFKSSR